MKAFKKAYDSGHGVITLELMTFPQDWLTGHIRNVDQKYSDFLNSKA